ncbi:MAG: GDP-mannose 4,6-dehydratase [Lachnospiraceae bacterium]|nr:GDP-mannose 4,6-dehydratase [Lachnospiraceae bacterium]
MKKALIFGAGGFVGGYLTEELQSHGYDVYGCGHFTKPEDRRLTDAYVCDILNQDQVKTVIYRTRPDCIVNLAGISSVGLSWRIPQTTVNVNVIGALNILETVSKTDLDPRILFIGSAEEYAAQTRPIRETDPLDANNPYGISKVMLERYCELYRSSRHMRVYYVRAFNHTGVGQADSFVIPSWCRQVAEISASGKPGVLRVGNLSVERDFCDVRDIVRAYRLVLESDDCSEVYNISSGEAIALQKMLEFITSLSTQEIEISVQENLIRPAENPYICGDHGKITEKLGWKPEIDLFETIRGMYISLL